jgi:hypothetical protein
MATLKQFALVIPTTIGQLVVDLGEIKNVVAALAAVIGSIVAIAPDPVLLRVSGLAAIVVSALGLAITDLKSTE